MSAVVVFGANGATGRVIVAEALRAGHTVTAAVRDPAAFRMVATDFPDAPLSVVRADLRHPDDANAAVADHDAVISAIGPAGGRADGLYSTAAHTLVAAMNTNRVDRLVALSSSGVRRGDPNHPLWYRVIARTVLRELYGDMRLMETIVRDSALDWTFVRSTRIVDEPPTGDYRADADGNPQRGTSIPRVDLARFMVQAVDDSRWSRAYPTIAR